MPIVGISVLDSPNMAKVTSIPTAHIMLFINVANIIGIMYGKYSFITKLNVLVPDSIAVYVNSLSLKLNICDLITLASHAHPNRLSISPNITIVRFSLITDAISMSMGNNGITTKLSFIAISTVSVLPPLYPATNPTITAIALDIPEAISAIVSEFLIAYVDCQNKSCPCDVVPNMCGQLGALSLGTTFHLSGSYGEKNDSIDMNASTHITMNANLNLPSFMSSLNPSNFITSSVPYSWVK